MNMEDKELDKLVERFWEGACTDAEEQQLRDCLKAGSLPERHAELRDYLSYVTQAQEEDTLGGSFDLDIMAEIDRQEAEASGFPTWFKIAAGIAIIIGLFALVQRFSGAEEEVSRGNELVMVDTYDDPEQAFEEVKKALKLVGRSMNEGMSHTEKLGVFQEAKEEISTDTKTRAAFH